MLHYNFFLFIFFAETTTVTEITTVVETTTVAGTTTVAETTPVAETTTVAGTTTVEQTTPVAETTKVAETTTLAETTTVAENTTVTEATVAEIKGVAKPTTAITRTAVETTEGKKLFICRYFFQISDVSASSAGQYKGKSEHERLPISTQEAVNFEAFENQI